MRCKQITHTHHPTVLHPPIITKFVIIFQMLDFAQYKENGGQSIAEVVAKLQPNKDARILECAAGTGYAGEQVKAVPFSS